MPFGLISSAGIFLFRNIIILQANSHNITSAQMYRKRKMGWNFNGCITSSDCSKFEVVCASVRIADNKKTSY